MNIASGTKHGNNEVSPRGAGIGGTVCRGCKQRFAKSRRTQNFCSSLCRREHANEIRRAKYASLSSDAKKALIDKIADRRLAVTHNCQQCNRAFRPRRGQQRFCSLKCLGQSRVNVAKQRARQERIERDARWALMCFRPLSAASLERLKKLPPSPLYGKVLARRGLPRNVLAAAAVLGIYPTTLRTRLTRNPDRLFDPVRPYLGRRTTVIVPKHVARKSEERRLPRAR